MKILQTVFHFIISITSLFVRKGRQCSCSAAGDTCTCGHCVPEHGSGVGRGRGNPVGMPPPNPVGTLGGLLILVAVGGYLYRLMG